MIDPTRKAYFNQGVSKRNQIFAADKHIKNDDDSQNSQSRSNFRRFIREVINFKANESPYKMADPRNVDINIEKMKNNHRKLIKLSKDNDLKQVNIRVK